MSISLKQSNNWDFKPSDLKHKLANCNRIAIHCSVLSSVAKHLDTKKLSKYSTLRFINHDDWGHDYMYAHTCKSYLNRIGIADIIIDDCETIDHGPNKTTGWVKLKLGDYNSHTESYRFRLQKDVDGKGEDEGWYVLCIMHDKWYHGCGSNKWWC